jgi:ArsR family transcriptional regulator
VGERRRPSAATLDRIPGMNYIYGIPYMTSSLHEPPDLFRAFADVTRLRILNLLLERELCVCDLCEVLGEIQPKVSRHLAILRRVALVRVRREGKWKFYALAEDPSPLQRRLLRCVGSCLSEVGLLAEDQRRLHSMQARLHRA